LGFRSRLAADACSAPVLRDQGLDRPAGHGEAEHHVIALAGELVTVLGAGK
jgi:hypothetical protein